MIIGQSSGPIYQESELTTGTVDVVLESNNTAQNTIKITEDRLELRLTAFLKRHERRNEWAKWLGTFLAVLTTIVTSSFVDVWIFKASLIQTVFVCVAILTGLATIRALYQLVSTPRISIESFIHGLRDDTTMPASQRALKSES
ncbi:hypothetical protein LRX75_21430 [Rhizobium sp. DKSPLA3]|uniref:Uncharacterized protein n=1 Tax=Rhizobium quercicola TaxID=2901226 RepID=A0A9X1NX84_9HYPH|nr:hypothetical protein [Rhizobium quercicola]MCD7111601.1 hypothetical protein [Rhizobium quercicola]